MGIYTLNCEIRLAYYYQLLPINTPLLPINTPILPIFTNYYHFKPFWPFSQFLNTKDISALKSYRLDQIFWNPWNLDLSIFLFADFNLVLWLCLTRLNRELDQFTSETIEVRNQNTMNQKMIVGFEPNKKRNCCFELSECNLCRIYRICLILWCPRQKNSH